MLGECAGFEHCNRIGQRTWTCMRPAWHSSRLNAFFFLSFCFHLKLHSISIKTEMLCHQHSRDFGLTGQTFVWRRERIVPPTESNWMPRGRAAGERNCKVNCSDYNDEIERMFCYLCRGTAQRSSAGVRNNSVNDYCRHA